MTEILTINVTNTITCDCMPRVCVYFRFFLSGQLTFELDAWQAKKESIQIERNNRKLTQHVEDLTYENERLRTEKKSMEDRIRKMDEESGWLIWMVKSSVHKLGVAILEDKDLEAALSAGEELAQALEVIGEYPQV